MWQKRINAQLQLCTDRRDSMSCQQLKESQSKLLTENQMGNLVMVYTKLFLSNNLSVQVVRFALLQCTTAAQCITQKSQRARIVERCKFTCRKPVLWQIYTPNKSLQHFLKDNYLFQYSLKTFHKTGRTCLKSIGDFLSYLHSLQIITFLHIHEDICPKPK